MVAAYKSSSLSGVSVKSHAPFQRGGGDDNALMLTAADVARMLACSTKSVYRLTDRGVLPRPVKLGGLLRWQRRALEQWVADGCPASRN